MKNYEEQYWAERAGKYNKTNWVKNEAFIEAFLGMLPQQDFKQIFEVGIGTGVVADKITFLDRGVTGYTCRWVFIIH